ncbi:MAG: DEAD/DEAH box helicase, partial [Nitrososphaerota archaeon]
NGFKTTEITVKHGDDLFEKTGSNEYDNFVISEINAKYNYVKFSNGIKIDLGEEQGGDRTDLMRVQIEQTIEEHFRKYEKLKKLGIKTLSLFFIDKVDNYLKDDGMLRKFFEESFNKLKRHYVDFKDLDVKTVHAGYFSKMKTEKAMEQDKDTFDLIMRDKERLLSFSEPVQFIFSHSALREGWDNPNVFNICTLNQTVSTMKKRQEIGRGMRLPVNQSGERILGDHNVLTVVANESYAHYVSKLQQEYVDEYGDEIAPPKPANARNRTVLKLKKGFQLNPEFKELWKRVAKRTKYAVNIDTDDLIKQCINEINGKISINSIKVKIEKFELSIEEENGIQTKLVGQGTEALDKTYDIPDIIGYISDETKLTRETIVKILTNIKNLDLIFKNPQEFVSSVSLIIKEKLADFLVNGIKYLEVDDWYKMELFTEIETYQDMIVPVEKTIYDGGIKRDSDVEKDFAKALEDMNNVKLFIKLPNWFVVETPIGEYNPDWAIVMDNTDQFGVAKDRLYFVTETKGTTNIDDLRPPEKRKIQCAIKHFKTVNVDYKIVNKAEQILHSK